MARKIKKCKKTGKTQYKSQKAAEKARFYIWSHDPNSDIYDMHVYVCPDCSCFHVGHKSKYDGE